MNAETRLIVWIKQQYNFTGGSESHGFAPCTKSTYFWLVRK